MDKSVRKIEVPLARNIIKKSGLYLVEKKDIDTLADIAKDAYIDYPLHNYFTKGKYNPKASKLIMKISLKTMYKDAVIYADSEEMNGFAVFLPFGFTGSKTLPFILNGGLKLIFLAGPSIIGRLLKYEIFAMKLKRKYTNNFDWYLYNLSVRKDAQGKGIASKLLKPMFKDFETFTKTINTTLDK
jgi:ribosomal protein S18 acetylase RimI-like enzyme